MSLLVKMYKSCDVGFETENIKQLKIKCCFEVDRDKGILIFRRFRNFVNSDY